MSDPEEESEDENEYAVEYILAVEVVEVESEVEQERCWSYLLKWHGYPVSMATPTPEPDMDPNLHRLMKSFWERVGRKDARQYEVGFKLPAPKDWIEKEKDYFQKEFLDNGSDSSEDGSQKEFAQEAVQPPVASINNDVLANSRRDRSEPAAATVPAAFTRKVRGVAMKSLGKKPQPTSTDKADDKSKEKEKQAASRPKGMERQVTSKSEDKGRRAVRSMAPRSTDSTSSEPDLAAEDLIKTQKKSGRRTTSASHRAGYDRLSQSISADEDVVPIPKRTKRTSKVARVRDKNLSQDEQKVAGSLVIVKPNKKSNLVARIASRPAGAVSTLVPRPSPAARAAVALTQMVGSSSTAPLPPPTTHAAASPTQRVGSSTALRPSASTPAPHQAGRQLELQTGETDELFEGSFSERDLDSPPPDSPRNLGVESEEPPSGVSLLSAKTTWRREVKVKLYEGDSSASHDTSSPQDLQPRAIPTKDRIIRQTFSLQPAAAQSSTASSSVAKYGGLSFKKKSTSGRPPVTQETLTPSNIQPNSPTASTFDQPFSTSPNTALIDINMVSSPISAVQTLHIPPDERSLEVEVVTDDPSADISMVHDFMQTGTDGDPMNVSMDGDLPDYEEVEQEAGPDPIEPEALLPHITDMVFPQESVEMSPVPASSQRLFPKEAMFAPSVSQQHASRPPLAGHARQPPSAPRSMRESQTTPAEPDLVAIRDRDGRGDSIAIKAGELPAPRDNTSFSGWYTAMRASGHLITYVKRGDESNPLLRGDPTFGLLMNKDDLTLVSHYSQEVCTARFARAWRAMQSTVIAPASTAYIDPGGHRLFNKLVAFLSDREKVGLAFLDTGGWIKYGVLVFPSTASSLIQALGILSPSPRIATVPYLNMISFEMSGMAELPRVLPMMTPIATLQLLSRDELYAIHKLGFTEKIFSYVKDRQFTVVAHKSSIRSTAHKPVAKVELYEDEVNLVIRVLQIYRGNFCPSEQFHVDKGIVFIDNKAWSDVHVLFPSFVNCRRNHGVTFFAFGASESLAPERFLLRQVFPVGGILTFTPQAILDDPTGVNKLVTYLAKHYAWNAYIVPSVIAGIESLGTTYEPSTAQWALASILLQVASHEGLAVTTAPRAVRPYPSQESLLQLAAWTNAQFDFLHLEPQDILQKCRSIASGNISTLSGEGLAKVVVDDMVSMQTQPRLMDDYRRFVVITSPAMEGAASHLGEVECCTLEEFKNTLTSEMGVNEASVGRAVDSPYVVPPSMASPLIS